MKGSLVRIWAVLLRHLYLYPVSTSRIMEIFYWPVLEILVWGFLSIYLAHNPGALPHWTEFLLGAVIFWGILNRSQQAVGVSFLEEVWSRNLLNLFASPLTPIEFLIATMLLSFIKFLLATIVTAFLAWIFYSYNLFQMGFWLLPLVANLVLMGWSIGIVTTSIILRFGQQAEMLAWGLALLIQPFAAVFYPVSILPRPLQAVARFLPCTYVFEGMRSIIAAGAMSRVNFFIPFLLNGVYLLCALAFFRRMYGQAQERGLLAKLAE